MRMDHSDSHPSSLHERRLLPQPLTLLPSASAAAVVAEEEEEEGEGEGEFVLG